jgi:hypothetical protein
MSPGRKNMNSTDNARLRRFFRKRLLPAAKKLQSRGVSFFELGPDDRAESWYEGPPSEPKFTSLNLDECEAALRNLWQEQELPELAELATELMQLAQRLEVQKEESSDVSSFVYVMY